MYAGAIARRLASRFPGIDPQLISDAAVRAVMWTSAHFERYDPGRGSLSGFLTAVARRILSTRLRSEQRRKEREGKKAIDPVTAAAPAAKSPLDELTDRERAERARESLNLSPEEGNVLDLWLLGEKALGVYAAALGLTDRPVEEQEREVRRVLGRLRQRIHRAGLRLRQQETDE
jgi:RNA polymerase sigma factor (sigma-70 family)